MKEIIEAILAAIGVLAILWLMFYTLSIRYLDWYHRVWLPRQPPESFSDGEKIIVTSYEYDPLQKIAVKRIKRTIGKTYNDKGEIE